ncbi:hypothetical protein [Actinokineospora sp. NBRC 105648]|uniref:hypothetical protein n=1 Tax=Actinokineospora sp. NBRC 105648 TaxID=3032206 RepID=UPI0024A06A93|nr:hypothetical protein [Actinokineospora sp. NBRC 105648]GLZ41293.1 hypothetical protein Acsp05_49170 [Actinokineospora sp. NBRC 105648]
MNETVGLLGVVVAVLSHGLIIWRAVARDRRARERARVNGLRALVRTARSRPGSAR